ncbi:hypothetical protein RHGRI_010067 [Rhododendron griersonianum]|uniref:T-complex protein 1 subunit theta n=1 Tax=Rhododendron griersonianum TaxID=479676 RepID=A0AAV6KHV7_9ERIC|nr:hypothetical protein RHGRI_010067 [Rhododendron griersonianum]
MTATFPPSVANWRWWSPQPPQSPPTPPSRGSNSLAARRSQFFCMNKMVINHLDKLFVTNDAATIVNELEVQHPAAKILVLAGKAQQEEIGDGANLTVSFAGELLQNAEELMRMGLHPSEIIIGYTKAINKTIEILDELVEKGSEKMDVKIKEEVIKRMKAAVASKQFGQEDILCSLIADACIEVCPKNPANFNVDNVRVAKLLGGGLHNCTIVRGMVLKTDAVGSIKRVEKAKLDYVHKKVQFNPHVRTDARQSRIQPRPRLYNSGSLAPTTLSWHLASETKSTLKDSSCALSSSEDPTTSSIASGVFHLVDAEESTRMKSSAVQFQLPNGGHAKSAAMQTFGTARMNTVEGSKALAASRSFDNPSRQEIVRAPVRSKSLISTFFVKQKTPKLKSVS